jgi:carbon-monoxide dehydrogenase medium subunit
VKPFAYEAPTTIDAAVALLAGGNGRALPLAGGTDVLVQLRRGAREADLLVDVKRIPELNRITFDPAGGLTVGAAVPCARLCEHPGVARSYPALIDAAGAIGGAATRERATLGGNLCNGAPSADSVPAMIVLDATCTLAGPDGTRTVRAQDVCTAPGETALGAGELLVSIHFPPPTPRSGACYVRFTPRREMDIAVAGAGACIALDEKLATITDARIALAAVAPTPLCAGGAAGLLVGAPPGDDAFSRAAAAAQDAARPIDDARGTSAQRSHLVGVLVKRALRTAASRAKRSINVETPGTQRRRDALASWLHLRISATLRRLLSGQGIRAEKDQTGAHKTRIQAEINGAAVEFLCEPHQSLLECLRDVLGLTGTKEGCYDGNCGACSVLLDGRLVNACLVLGVEVEGHTITTIEGLAGWRGLHPLQQAFLDQDALQCGYCTPGVLIASKALLDREPDPDEKQVRAWLAGNLCRCTGYDRIVRAVRSAAACLAEQGGEASP